MLGLLTILIVASGASCPRRFQSTGPSAPTVFFAAPSIDQIVQVVNANTAKVRQLQTTAARLTVAGAPSLRASLALERPLRFRLRGDTGLTGNELDLGSNDELFWMWTKRNDPPAVFFARHAEFQAGAHSGMLPLPPTWLVEELGLIQLDTGTAYDGPHAVAPGQVQLRYLTGGTQPLMKTIVVDDQRGHVLSQQVYDSTGTLLATARMSDYRFDSINAVSLPHQVEVELPPAGMSFSFTVEGYTVNALSADPLSLWSMPQLPTTQYVDLAQQAELPVTMNP
jgi:hypothetical protein